MCQSVSQIFKQMQNIIITQFAQKSQKRMLSQAQKTILGIMIIKFATGFTADWGVISLYVLSFYHYYGAPIQIKASTNSLLMIILVIPVTICLIISTKLANYVGYVRLIRICAIAYLILPLFSFINFNLIVFILCNLIAPASTFTLSLIPIFNCMYSHYGNNKSLATGMVICSFSVGAIVWNIVSTMAINPDNTVPDVETQDPNLKFFSREITDRVPRTMNYIYLISGILFFGASFLITKNQEYADPYLLLSQSMSQRSRIKQKRSLQPNTQQKQDKRSGPFFQNQPQRVQQPGQSPQQIKGQIIQFLSASQRESVIDPRLEQDLSPLPKAARTKRVQLLKYLKHPIVLLLFLLNISGCIYQIYVQLNTKLIYMPILQDDHLISLGLMLIIISSAVFSVPWGFLADRKGPAAAIITFIIVDLAVKIFASVTKSKACYIISMILIGGTDKTMLVLFAPIIIDAFGLQVATQLLPLKGLSGIISVILASGFGLIFSKIPPQKALYGLCTFSLLNLILGGLLANIIGKYQHKRVKTLANNIKNIQAADSRIVSS